MVAVNPIDVVEHAYDLAGDSRQWLETIARSVYPLLDGQRGLVAYHYDTRTAPASWLEHAVTFDMPDGGLDALRVMMQDHAQSHVAQMHTIPRPLEGLGEACRSAGVEDPRFHPAFKVAFERLGTRDVLALRTIEPCGRGIVIAALQAAERDVDQRSKRLWAKVSAHLAAGRRLRERLSTEPVEAVLTPSGELEHAEGDSKSNQTREALRNAVLRQERARGRARRDDPEAATDMWTALISGRWSLVDHFERGGRRYIVARRNEHGVADPRALRTRERDVAQLAALGKSNKLIAYELGISESTVGTHLSNAMRKLGVTTRVELLRMLMQLAQSSAST